MRVLLDNGTPRGVAGALIGHGHICEIKSALILQPGPAALTDGLQQIHRIVERVSRAVSVE